MDGNLTSKYEGYLPPTPQAVILVLINGFGCALGTTANALVIIVILNMRYLRTNRNFILASLSGSDLISCVMWQPILIDNVLNGLRFNLLVTFCTFFSSLSSLNNLVCLTAERFIAVHFPFRYLSSLTDTRVTVICTMAYGTSLLLASLIATASIPVNVIHFYIVLLTFAILVIYVNIYITAIKQVRRINAMQISVTTIDSVPRQPAKNIENSNTTASVGIVVGIFIFCWLPFLLLPAIPYTKQVFPWINTFALMQSNINPFLYFWKFARFRRGFKRFLQKLKYRFGMME